MIKMTIMCFRINNIFSLLGLCILILFSCQDLEEININPNGVDPASAHPNLLMATVITQSAQSVVGLGYGNLAGVMQHTQKDGWSGAHNSYDWTDQSWNGYYSILRNNDEMSKKAEASGLDFHQGLGLVIKSYVFGLITDLWGDAPYSQALNGEAGGAENIKPAFDAQKDIYDGILADLEKANTLLSQDQGAYSDINPTQDVLFGGDASKWQKLANSVALRYYMRLSEKDPGTAKAGVEKILSDPGKYPLILDQSDDANMDYVGNSSGDSWPQNTVFDGTGGSNYRRLKMCATLVDALQELNDPRLPLWAKKIDVQIIVDPDLPDDMDEIVDGVRRVARNVADQYESSLGFPLDSDPDYVGLPPAWSIVPQAYNLNPNLEQAPNNPHASHLNDMYKSAAGSLLQARMMSASEVHFILAEAAMKGWSVGGSAEDHYNAGIQASLASWDLAGSADQYMAGENVTFDGTQEQILQQKWIASWTAAAESWFDYRRTGLPALQAGVVVKRTVLPVRFYYSRNETDFNPQHAQSAIDKLEATDFTSPDGNNSAWSKMWVLQGTGKPW